MSVKMLRYVHTDRLRLHPHWHQRLIQTLPTCKCVEIYSQTRLLGLNRPLRYTILSWLLKDLDFIRTRESVSNAGNMSISCHACVASQILLHSARLPSEEITLYGWHSKRDRSSRGSLSGGHWHLDC